MRGLGSEKVLTPSPPPLLFLLSLFLFFSLFLPFFKIFYYFPPFLPPFCAPSLLPSLRGVVLVSSSGFEGLKDVY